MVINHLLAGMILQVVFHRWTPTAYHLPVGVGRPSDRGFRGQSLRGKNQKEVYQEIPPETVWFFFSSF